MKNFILVLFSALCVACATARQAAPSEKIITETRIETVFQTDTVFLEVPKIVEKIVTADTVSVLENEYAKSEASVSDGLLAHSLETKPIQQPVEVEKELTGWQSFKMKMGGWFLGILSLLALAAIIWIIIKILLKRA